MKCPTCKVDVREAPPVEWLGVNAFRQPVVQYKCQNGHSVKVGLVTLKTYGAPRAAEFPAHRGEYFHGAGGIQFCCPLCTCMFDMTKHHVQPDGLLVATVICPGGCGFVANVRFLDWKPAETPKPN